ncbi:MAG: o-succinylbenzoate synthase [Acidobacteria bacterium]|nr:o-succinylbenzoate synthase [Acidobacteriota bacterium]
MRIETVTLAHIRIPLVEPFRISSGEVREKDAIIVGIYAGRWSGFGESSPMAGSFYSSDTPESCWSDLKDVIVPAMLQADCDSLADWNEKLDAVTASNFAKTGFETALWDLEATRQGKSLHELLGGEKTRVESGLAVGLYDTIHDTLRATERYLGEGGYKRVKLKIEPGRDVELIRAARKTFGDIPMFVDANGAYTLQDVEVFRQLDEFGLMMFEQPFPGGMLEELAELQSQLKTPICLDESLDSLEAFERAAALGSGKIANIKIQRIGGLYHARRLHDAAQQRGIPCWMGTMPELGLGSVQAAAMASLDKFPTDVEASSRWFVDDIVTPPLEVNEGMIELSNWKVNFQKLEQYAISSYTVAQRV